MKRYEKYKDSGIEWIGEIPAHWEDVLANFLFKERNIKGNPELELLASTQDKGVIPKTELEYNTVTALKNFESFKTVFKNDFVISLRSFEGGFEHSNFVGIISPAYFVFYLIRKNEPIYFKYLFKSYLFIRKIQSISIGIRDGKTIRFEQFKNVRLPLPPPEEQTAIANYLDRKTAEIDELIAKKEELLKLYEEEKNAIINQAVTKGLTVDYNGINDDQDKTEQSTKLVNHTHQRFRHFKGSGIEWLGEIPAHWEVKKLKYVIQTISGGGTPSTDVSHYWDGNIPWVSPKDMKSEIIETTIDCVSNIAIEESSTSLVEKNNILLVVRSGILKHSLPIAINSVPVCLNQDMKALKPNKDLFILFFFWLLKGISNNILTLCKKLSATVDSIEMQYLLNFPILIPPLEEQTAIVAHIEKETARINAKVEKTKKLIELLKEYRTALISEAVTGKIKVPGV